MAEYYYYHKWNDEYDEPEKVFVLDKRMSDSNPEELYSEEYGKTVDVKRWINSAPAFLNSDDNNHQFESKYKSFHEKQKEGRDARGHVPLKDIVESADLTFEHSSIDPVTGNEVVEQKPITDTVVPTEQWKRLSKEKRRLCERIGILSQEHFVSPGQVTPRNHTKLSKKSEENHESPVEEEEILDHYPPRTTTLQNKDGEDIEVVYIEY